MSTMSTCGIPPPKIYIDNMNSEFKFGDYKLRLNTDINLFIQVDNSNNSIVISDKEFNQHKNTDFINWLKNDSIQWFLTGNEKYHENKGKKRRSLKEPKKMNYFSTINKSILIIQRNFRKYLEKKNILDKTNSDEQIRDINQESLVNEQESLLDNNEYSNSISESELVENIEDLSIYIDASIDEHNTEMEQEVHSVRLNSLSESLLTDNSSVISMSDSILDSLRDSITSNNDYHIPIGNISNTKLSDNVDMKNYQFRVSVLFSNKEEDTFSIKFFNKKQKKTKSDFLETYISLEEETNHQNIIETIHVSDTRYISKNNSHTQYKIVIQCTNGRVIEKWLRYSELYQFKKNFISQNNSFLIDLFPKKKWFNKNSTKVVEERMNSFQQFFNSLNSYNMDLNTFNSYFN